MVCGMSFHPSQVTRLLREGTQSSKTSRVAGFDFPGATGGAEEKIGRIEAAIVAISAAIETLATDVERLAREIRQGN